MPLVTAARSPGLAAAAAAARTALSFENGSYRTASAQFRRLTVSSKNATAAEKYQAYMKDANAQMKKYHDARELKKQGKLINLNGRRGPENLTAFQAGLALAFLLTFLATPFIGKRIAQDEEFREKWVPAWYDFTVKQPKNAWTREELHEQMLLAQQEIRNRAIAGDFAPDKLNELQDAFQSHYPHRAGVDRTKIPAGWDRIHPGLDDDEELNEAE